MIEISENIATNLKNLRKSRQLTLEDLAEQSGVSKSMLGEIERGRTNPTITILWKIAQALKTPLTTLYESQAESYTVVRKIDRIPFNQEIGHTIASIFPYYEPHQLEILEIDLAPRSELSNPGHAKGVEEYLIVLSGSVAVAVRDKEIRLATLDSIRFAADGPHKIGNIATSPAKLLNIICYK